MVNFYVCYKVIKVLWERAFRWVELILKDILQVHTVLLHAICNHRLFIFPFNLNIFYFL